MRNRAYAEDWLAARIADELERGHGLCIGFDFAFGYPRGFAEALTGKSDPLALWDWFEARVEDAPKQNNRAELAGQINAMFEGIGPFWGNPSPKLDVPDLPRKGLARTCSTFAERRVVETRAKGSFPVWQLAGAGAVGSQVIMGLPVLARLRQRFTGRVSVWPFEPLDTPVALVEVWPSLIAGAVAEGQYEGEIKDAAQVRLLARALSRLDQVGRLEPILADGRTESGEGWILGVGFEEEIAAMARDSGTRLPNDCFALPPGVDWTPVDVALASLKDSLTPVVGVEKLAISNASGRVLAEDLTAARSNPPGANSAIDGYGFAFDGFAPEMPLVPGRAAPGDPYRAAVPKGQAIRILTGALLPEGVDTILMQEEASVSDGLLRAQAKVKRGQNARAAGEDVKAGDLTLRAGTRLRPQDVALATAVGVAEAAVFKPLRVGVISTGDELAPPAPDTSPDRTFDANRPMLMGLAEAWGHVPVDLGHVEDTRDALRARMRDGALSCDVILTSGGASAGDADHVSALLSEEGALTHWRVAIKPGRPLALAVFDGVPVFGLPGNPVAAFVCALIFARPAFSALSGGGWTEPVGFDVPAAFSKSKKRGRREYLRARLTADGTSEVFASEGSGRISGLSWAEGLVELGDDAREITPGDLVRYIPFGSFGL
ncbi:MAG: molybdopterin-binding protein, partial [Litoreibacter sp.]|nr:molybdopterin-binding protein [Litoreibacter sp.]